MTRKKSVCQHASASLSQRKRCLAPSEGLTPAQRLEVIFISSFKHLNVFFVESSPQN